MVSNISSVKENLSKPTPFGFQLWVLLIFFIFLLSILLIIFFFLFRCIIHRRRKKSYEPRLCFPSITISSKDHHHNAYRSTSSLDRRLLPLNISEIEMNARKLTDHGPVLSDHLFRQGSRTTHSSMINDVGSMGKYSPVVREVWRGSRFSLKEIEVATNGFAKENLIGNGDYGRVYHGILFDTTRVAVKRILNNRYLYVTHSTCTQWLNYN